MSEFCRNPHVKAPHRNGPGPGRQCPSDAPKRPALSNLGRAVRPPAPPHDEPRTRRCASSFSFEKRRCWAPWQPKGIDPVRRHPARHSVVTALSLLRRPQDPPNTAFAFHPMSPQMGRIHLPVPLVLGCLARNAQCTYIRNVWLGLGNVFEALVTGETCTLRFASESARVTNENKSLITDVPTHRISACGSSLNMTRHLWIGGAARLNARATKARSKDAQSSRSCAADCGGPSV